MAHSIHVSLLGGLDVRIDGNAVAGLSMGGKVPALFAFLAHDPRPWPRETLAALLWEDSDEDQARSSLRQALTAIRQQLPPGAIEADRDAVRLADTVSDVAAFRECLAETRPDGLARAMALYRGDLLEGFHVRANAFERWLADERQRIQEEATGALVRLLETETLSAVADLHVPDALRLLALDTTQEALHRALMRHYARHGQHAAALRQYFHCRDALEHELDARPEPETEALYRLILHQDGTRRIAG